MKVIEEIEHRVRGVYTGAIGYIAPDDRAVFSVAIRTIILSEGVGNMGTGGGIVWDSTKDAEYRECQLKASFLTGLPVGPDLIETVAWRRDDGFRLLDRNVARIRASAGELGYPFDESIFRSRLKELVAEFSAPRYRVRILLHADGELSVSSTPLKGGSVLPGSVSISDIRTDPDDVWLRHKTTQREIYDAEYARAQEEGHTEVLFLNRHGQVTEGSRTNIFVMKDEVLSTPPLSCGLLPGTRRAEVLEMRGDAVERPLFLADLVAADVIYLCNATTRLTPVSLEID